MKLKILIVIVVVILVVLAGAIFLPKYFQKTESSNSLESELAKIKEKEKEEAKPIEYEKKETDFILMDLSENEVNLFDYRGQKVFLHFWGPNCPPCFDEMGYIDEIYEENYNIEIITIPLIVNLNELEKYLENNPHEYKILIDLDGRVRSKYSVVSVPVSILINEFGEVINTHKGPMNKEELIEFMKLD